MGDYTKIDSESNTSHFSNSLCYSCACDNICIQSICWYGCAQCLWAENQFQLGFETDSNDPCWTMSSLTLIYPMLFNLMGLGPIGIVSQCVGNIKGGQSRTRFRKEYNIKTDPCCSCACCANLCFAGDKDKQADCCQWMWFPACSLCQESRQIKTMKERGILPCSFHPPIDQIMSQKTDVIYTNL